ncbi:hypothetical protein [Mucilaginibacter sp.]|uniref:hypothetical protein n=1 Tax=Mucilaginibacter sp. TaxID=1882438 RepID=UPI003D0E45BE
MLTPFYMLYYGILIVASTLSYIAFKKGDNKSIYILILLVVTFLFEILTQVLSKNQIKGFTYIYDIFNAVEYALFCLYYLNACKIKGIRIWAKISIMLFSIFSLCVAYLIYGFGNHYRELVSLNINIEGVLLFIIYTHLLFSIDNNITIPIYKHPDFWIAVGVLTFYGGVFVLFVLYPILTHIDTITASIEYGFIMEPLNLFIYFCIILGMLCLLRNKKYLIQ